MFQPLRLFLEASEHSDGNNLSVISTGPPLFQVKCCKDDVGCVSYLAQCEALTNLWLKDKQNCRFGHFHWFNLLLGHVLATCMDGGYSQRGQPASKGGVTPPTSPLNETLGMVTRQRP